MEGRLGRGLCRSVPAATDVSGWWVGCGRRLLLACVSAGMHLRQPRTLAVYAAWLRAFAVGEPINVDRLDIHTSTRGAGKD